MIFVWANNSIFPYTGFSCHREIEIHIYFKIRLSDWTKTICLAMIDQQLY